MLKLKYFIETIKSSKHGYTKEQTETIFIPQFMRSFLVRFFQFALLLVLFTNCSSSESSDDPISMPDEEVEETVAIINLATEAGTTLDFGSIVQNNSSTQNLKVTNTGNSNLVVSSIQVPDGLELDWTSGTIPANSSQDITVTFKPIAVQDYQGDIVFTSNASSGASVIGFTGVGISTIYDGDVTLENQQEVDDFSKLGYTEITGRLFIGIQVVSSTSDISDLFGLVGLVKVGAFRLMSTTDLTDLSGLQNMQVSQSISINYTDGLENIDALALNTELTDHLNISFNTSLKNIDGLTNMIRVGKSLIIGKNKVLENLNGLVSVTSIGEDFGIDENPLITTLNALSVTTVGGNITIANNDALFDFCGIKAVLLNGFQGDFRDPTFNRYNPTADEIVNGICGREVPADTYHGTLRIGNQFRVDRLASKGYRIIEGSLLIQGNPEGNDVITSFEGMSTVEEITGRLQIIRTSIENLEGWNNLTRVGDRFQVIDNAQLTDFCGVVSLFQAPNGLSDTVFPTGNGYNPTQQDLEAGICTE